MTPAARPTYGCVVQATVRTTDLVPDLFAVARRLRQAGSRQAGAPSLDVTAMMLLHRLSGSGPARLSELATELGLDLSTISRHATSLERESLVTRTVDPDDRRATRLEMTPQGGELLEEALAHRRRALRTATATWPAADLQTLATMLHRLARDLDPAGPSTEDTA